MPALSTWNACFHTKINPLAPLTAAEGALPKIRAVRFDDSEAQKTIAANRYRNLLPPRTFSPSYLVTSGPFTSLSQRPTSVLHARTSIPNPFIPKKMGFFYVPSDYNFPRSLVTRVPYPRVTLTEDPYFGQEMPARFVAAYLTSLFECSILPCFNGPANLPMHPELSLYIAQMLVICDLPYSVLATTLAVVCFLHDSRVSWKSWDQKAIGQGHLLFLLAFSIAARHHYRDDPGAEAHNPYYWAFITHWPVGKVKALFIMHKGICPVLESDTFTASVRGLGSTVENNLMKFWNVSLWMEDSKRGWGETLQEQECQNTRISRFKSWLGRVLYGSDL